MVIDAAMSLVSFRFAFLFLLAAAAVSCAILSSIKTSEMDRDVQYSVFVAFNLSPIFFLLTLFFKTLLVVSFFLSAVFAVTKAIFIRIGSRT